MSRTPYSTRGMVDVDLETIERALPKGQQSVPIAIATLGVQALCLLVRAVADVADAVRKDDEER